MRGYHDHPWFDKSARVTSALTTWVTSRGASWFPGCSRQPDNHLRNFAQFGELLAQACGGPVRLSLTPRLLLAEHNAADEPAAKAREE